MKSWPSLAALERYRALLADRGLALPDDDLAAMQGGIRTAKASSLRQARARARNPPPTMTQGDWERREIMAGDIVGTYVFPDGSRHYVGVHETMAQAYVQAHMVQEAERAERTAKRRDAGAKGGAAKRKKKPFSKVGERQQQKRKKKANPPN